MSYQDIIVEKVEGWLEVTINRPEKLNSLREQTAEEILAALSEAESDRAVGAIILKGSDKAFCTGIDTSEFQIKENEYFDFYRKRKRS
jgi:enoyl-CoA hydratase/carnithine racemase